MNVLLLDPARQALFDPSTGQDIGVIADRSLVGPDGPPTIRSELVLIAWSGTLCTTSGETPNPANWSTAAWDALESSVCQIVGTGQHVWVRPRVSHIVSDGASCRRLLGVLAGGEPTDAADGVGVLLDPIGCLNEGMVGDAEDHVARMMDLLTGCQGIRGVVVRDGDPAEGSGGGPLVGGVPRDCPRALARGCESSGVPIVLVGGDHERRVGLLLS